MEIKEMLSSYLKTVAEKDKNLVSIAFDELESSQYEEATKHFDQLYVQDSSDFMAYFFRAYCKSHTGKRGDVYPDSQQLTSAFELTVKKAIEAKKNLTNNLHIIISLYLAGMDNLAYNAVAEVRIDSNGNKHTTNPDKTKINNNKRNAILNLVKTYNETIKNDDEICKYVIGLLHEYEKINLKDFGGAIVSLDPSYQKELDGKIKKAKKKKIIIIAVVAGVIILFGILSAIL